MGRSAAATGHSGTDEQPRQPADHRAHWSVLAYQNNGATHDRPPDSRITVSVRRRYAAHGTDGSAPEASCSGPALPPCLISARNCPELGGDDFRLAAGIVVLTFSSD